MVENPVVRMTKAQEVAYFRRLLELSGHPLTAGARVLDFGCGEGALVQAFIDEGFDAYGCDIVVAAESDRLRLIGSEPYGLPFADATFDYVVSQQVFEHVQDYSVALTELRRVLKPGGVGINVFPPPMRILEGHVLVPFASILRQRAWLYLWARLGIRNQFQEGLPARQVMQINHAYLRDHTTYYSRRRVLREARAIFPAARLAELEMLAAAPSRKGQLAYAVAKHVPPLGTLLCELRMRGLLLR